MRCALLPSSLLLALLGGRPVAAQVPLTCLQQAELARVARGRPQVHALAALTHCPVTGPATFIALWREAPDAAIDFDALSLYSPATGSRAVLGVGGAGARAAARPRAVRAAALGALAMTARPGLVLRFHDLDTPGRGGAQYITSYVLSDGPVGQAALAQSPALMQEVAAVLAERAAEEPDATLRAIATSLRRVVAPEPGPGP